MQRIAVLALAGLGLAGCGDPNHARHFPVWQVAPLDREVTWVGCLGVRPIVRKSGKQGIGMTLELRSRTDCAGELRARLALADGTTSEARLAADLRGRSLVYRWIALHFDGDAAWNRGARRGELRLELGDATATVPLVEPWDGVWGDE